MLDEADGDKDVRRSSYSDSKRQLGVHERLVPGKVENSLVDTFSIYATMIERSRKNSEIRSEGKEDSKERAARCDQVAREIRPWEQVREMKVWPSTATCEVA